MTLVEKIITLAALDMPPQMIVRELSHQHPMCSIRIAIYRLQVKGWLAGPAVRP